MVQYISPIDPHVHFRWNEYKTDYMDLAFRDAREVGIIAMIAQGNTTPPLTTKEAINNYLARADKYRGDIGFFVHGVLTPDLHQQEDIMKLAEDRNSRVVSAKIFYVRSTNSGQIEITDEEDQRQSWELGRVHDFNGNRTGHFEDSAFFKGAFDPKQPLTHSTHQDAEAEIAQVERQLKNAYDSYFRGNFIIFHTSNPDTIDYVDKQRNKLSFKVFTEATWHHIFLNTEDYKIHGNRVKMNPPLRTREMQEKLLDRVLSGKVDMIGTDHAPHPIERKDDPEKPASGVTAIAFYPKGVELLQKLGIKQGVLDNILFYNVNEVYGLKQTAHLVDVEYNPHLWDAYGFNPFSKFDN